MWAGENKFVIHKLTLGERVDSKDAPNLPLDRAALSVALGRDNVVHVALTDPAAAARLQAPLQRLIHFLGNETEATESGTGAVANDDIDTKGE